MGNNSSDLSAPTFSSLVVSLSSTAWIGLGKIVDPLTGKLKVDLKSAKYSIDTLIMLREKTRGNLTEDEKRLLDSVIADLQANYAETVFSSAEKKDEKDQETDNRGQTEKKSEPRKEQDKSTVSDGSEKGADGAVKQTAKGESKQKGRDKKEEAK